MLYIFCLNFIVADLNKVKTVLLLSVSFTPHLKRLLDIFFTGIHCVLNLVLESAASIEHIN